MLELNRSTFLSLLPSAGIEGVHYHTPFICYSHVQSHLTGVKSHVTPLELELQMVVSSRVGADNQTQLSPL